MNGWDARRQRSTVVLPWWAVPGAVAMAIGAVVMLAHEGGLGSGVTVDHGRGRIVIAPALPGSFDVCDGETGACFALENLRAATAAIGAR